jgi:hypothetical protein
MLKPDPVSDLSWRASSVVRVSVTDGMSVIEFRSLWSGPRIEASTVES